MILLSLCIMFASVSSRLQNKRAMPNVYFIFRILTLGIPCLMPKITCWYLSWLIPFSFLKYRFAALTLFVSAFSLRNISFMVCRKAREITSVISYLIYILRGLFFKTLTNWSLKFAWFSNCFHGVISSRRSLRSVKTRSSSALPCSMSMA